MIKIALIKCSISVHYQRQNVSLSFSQEKITLFLHPRQWHKKYVGPKIKLKAQRIISGIRKVYESVFLKCFFYLSYIRKIPYMKLTI
jgi:hypothetical protein